MRLKHHLLLLIVFYLWIPHVSAEACTAPQIEKNLINNAILNGEPSPTERIKDITITADSPDKYITSILVFNFDQCGAMVKSEGHRLKRDLSTKEGIISELNVVTKKVTDGWEAKFSFELSMSNKNSRKETKLFSQKSQEIYTLNKQGIIDQSMSRFTALAGGTEQEGVAHTTFTLNSANQLVNANRKSNIARDSGITQFEYDAAGRLIKQQSSSTLKELTYDAQGRELASTEIQHFFTVEKTVTLCQKWNQYGRCIESQQQIMQIIKDKTGKENIVVHQAVIKAHYSYWDQPAVAQL